MTTFFPIVQTAVLIGLGYLLIGGLFGIAFVIRGIDRVDLSPRDPALDSG